jgi:iron complex outermembrane recepter protein
MKLPLVKLGAKTSDRRIRAETLHGHARALPTRKHARPRVKAHLAGFSICSALLLTAPGLRAQQSVVFDNSCRWTAEKLWPDDILLNPFVVTPVRREQRLNEAPSTTTIIAAEEICRSGATNIPDLLRMVPGLDIFRISASDVNVTARGLNSRLAHRMQVYIDGRSVYEDFLNLVFWHELPISLQEIERIEIVKSPISALYGANAFSGVIHIITKTPEALKGTQITATAGNGGTHITNTIHAGVHGDFSYKLSFEHDRTHHFPNPEIHRSNDDKGREDFRGNVFAEYKFSGQSRASFAAGMDAFDRDLDPGLVPSPAPPTRVFANGGLGFIKLNYSLDDFKFQFAWDRLDMDLRSKILPREVPVIANTFKLDAQHNMHLGMHNLLTGGLGYRHHMFDSKFLIGPTHNQDLFSVFLQNEYSPFKELTFTMGVRVDTHPEAGVTVAPRGSIVYSPWENHTFRASISRAFRSPSVLENFINFGVVTGLPPPADVVIIRGNKNLDPEEITSYELGYQTLLFQRLKARVDLFYNQLDKMSTGVTQTGPFEFTVLTQGGGHIFGGEIGFEFLFNNWLKGFANYSYQQRHLDRNVLGVAPRHKGSVGLSFNLPKRFEADVFMNALGRSTGLPAAVDPYTTVNLRLGYPFEVLGAKARVSFAVSNLFNDKHKEFPGGDSIERRITGLLQFRF